MKSKLKRNLSIVFIIILVIASVYFLFKPEDQTTDSNLNSTIKVERGDLTETLDLSGQVLVANLVEIKTQAIGTVEEILVKENQSVKTGDKLFKLSFSPEGKEKNNSAYANYLNAKNSLTTAQTNYHNLQSKLFTENEKFKDFVDEKERVETDPELIIANANWLQAEEEYKNQTGKIQQLQINLNSAYQDYLNSSATVTASHDGIIESITIAKGMNIGDATSANNSTNLSDRLAVIKIDDQQNLAKFTLSEADIFKVELNQEIQLTLDNQKNSQFEGTIISIDKIGNIDSDITTYPIIVSFSNPNQKSVLPNMNLSGVIALNEKKQVLNIPSLALSQANNKNFVTLVRQGQEQKIEVETGLIINGRTEISSGLSEGDEIVIKLKSFDTNKLGGIIPGMGKGMK
jgi:RND family efflux transporter MFP subunit